MTIKLIRLSNQAIERRIRLKTRTGIGRCGILSRRAFRLSLWQSTPPTPIELAGGLNVEMEWQVVRGEALELSRLAQRALSAG